MAGAEVLGKFSARRFDDVPDDTWDTKKVAVWAANQIMTHEQICAQRWGILIKLMWSALAGIGSLLILVTGTCISNWISRVH